MKENVTESETAIAIAPGVEAEIEVTESEMSIEPRKAMSKSVRGSSMRIHRISIARRVGTLPPSATETTTPTRTTTGRRPTAMTAEISAGLGIARKEVILVLTRRTPDGRTAITASVSNETSALVPGLVALVETAGVW